MNLIKRVAKRLFRRVNKRYKAHLRYESQPYS